MKGESMMWMERHRAALMASLPTLGLCCLIFAAFYCVRWEKHALAQAKAQAQEVGPAPGSDDHSRDLPPNVGAQPDEEKLKEALEQDVKNLPPATDVGTILSALFGSKAASWLSGLVFILTLANIFAPWPATTSKWYRLRLGLAMAQGALGHGRTGVVHPSTVPPKPPVPPGGAA